MPRNSRLNWKPVAVAAVLIALLVAFLGENETEVFTTDEILAKQEWSEEELVDTLSRTQMQRRTRGVRPEVFQHLRAQVEKLPEPQRREIVRKSVDKAVDDSIRQWHAMEPPVREQLVEAMLTEAKKNRTTVEKLSPERKERLRKRMESPEAKAWMHETRQRMLNRLTPEDRKLLAPLVKEWLETLESL